MRSLGPNESARYCHAFRPHVCLVRRLAQQRMTLSDLGRVANPRPVASAASICDWLILTTGLGFATLPLYGRFAIIAVAELLVVAHIIRFSHLSTTKMLNTILRPT